MLTYFYQTRGSDAVHHIKQMRGSLVSAWLSHTSGDLLSASAGDLLSASACHHLVFYGCFS